MPSDDCAKKCIPRTLLRRHHMVWCLQLRQANSSWEKDWKGTGTHHYIHLHTNTENSNRWLKIQNQRFYNCLVQSTEERQRRSLLASNEAAETKYATDIIWLHQPCCGWYCWYGWYCWDCWYCWFWFASKFLLVPRSPGRSDFLWRLDHDFTTTRRPPRPRKLLSMQTPLLAQTPWAHWHTLRPMVGNIFTEKNRHWGHPHVLYYMILYGQRSNKLHWKWHEVAIRTRENCVWWNHMESDAWPSVFHS